jgi:hypothetical protein
VNDDSKTALNYNSPLKERKSTYTNRFQALNKRQVLPTIHALESDSLSEMAKPAVLSDEQGGNDKAKLSRFAENESSSTCGCVCGSILVILDRAYHVPHVICGHH